MVDSWECIRDEARELTGLMVALETGFKNLNRSMSRR